MEVSEHRELGGGDPRDLRSFLEREAALLGFGRLGFTHCESFEAERERIEAWLRAGGAELFPYLDTPELLDPARMLPGARTAVVGFFPYARPEAVPGTAKGSLRLSRYLWGTDYHIVLKGRMKRLLEMAQARYPGLEGRVCVDTAPLLERHLAERAGLGWRGKHTLLIAGKGGSWGFLGIWLLNQELPLDRPFPRQHCGACTACLDACPTGALQPFRLDPGLCLTTYNLETELPPSPPVLKALAETGWAAGCDICQEVCPWNASPLFGDASLWGAPGGLHDCPAEELPRSTAQWRKITRRSALRRVRHRHWLATLARILGPDG